ncbi:MAG: redoxin family protein [Pseudomonadota bacterium]
MMRWLAILPLIALIGLAILAATQLGAMGRTAQSNDGSSAPFELSDGRPAPERSFTQLEGGILAFNPNPDPDGRTIAVNLFASWCTPCRAEHPLLQRIADDAPDQIYGVLYEDTIENGRAFLTALGDPFTAIVHDPDGQGGLDFGLTGVPETFVVNGDGQIILHIRGPLTPETARQVSALLAG